MVARICGLGACVLALPLPAVAAERPVAGWIERVRLGTEGLIVTAKLDTGATTSSLHAAGIRWFTREDGDWVAFEVIGANGTKSQFERKVVRIVRIKRVGAEMQRRPTVMMGVCLGSVYRVTEVNLTDRSGLNYEFLVGRRFLANYFTVDAARTYTLMPSCPEARPR